MGHSIPVSVEYIQLLALAASVYQDNILVISYTNFFREHTQSQQVISLSWGTSKVPFVHIVTDSLGTSPSMFNPK